MWALGKRQTDANQNLFRFLQASNKCLPFFIYVVRCARKEILLRTRSVNHLKLVIRIC